MRVNIGLFYDGFSNIKMGINTFKSNPELKKIIMTFVKTLVILRYPR